MYFWDDFVGAVTGSAMANLYWATITTGTGATVIGGVVNDAARPGIVTFNTGSTGTGAGGLRQGSNNTTSWPIVIGGGTITITFSMRVRQLSTAADIFIVRIGLMNANNAGLPGSGVYLEYTDPGGGSPTPNWSICTANSTAHTTTATNTAVDTNWHRYQIVINAAGTSAAFSIDGVAFNVSPIATNLPAPAIGPEMFILKANGSTATTPCLLDVDYFMMFQKLTSAR